MHEYKYVHIFPQDDLKFSVPLINMLNDPKNNFVPEEHLVIVFFDEVRSALSIHKNLLLSSKSYVDTINEFAPRCQWLFLHSLLPRQIVKIKKEYLTKIIWRSWGHDAGYIYRAGQPFRNIVKFFFNLPLRKLYRSLRFIGVANLVDVMDLESRFGPLPTHRMPYGAKLSPVDILRNSSSPCTNILIGHSGHLDDDHINIIKKFKKFMNENVQFYLILSYGPSEYIEKVEQTAKHLLKDKVTIIKDFMPYFEYINFLSNIDIAVLNGRNSYALGLLSLLLKGSKKIVVNKYGVIRKALKLEEIPHETTSNIKNLTFAELKEPYSYEAGENLVYQSPISPVNCWNDLLNQLNNTD